MKKLYFLLAFFLPLLTHAQKDGDLLSLLGEDHTTEYATASFKTTRVINGHSIENTGAGVLDFRINHRFGPVRQMVYDLFGLDGATINFGFDYGITSRLMVGVSRSSKEKIIDGFAKYKLLRQSKGAKNMPVTLSYVLDAQIKTVKFADQTRTNHFTDRLYYTHQLLIGRKFSDRLTLQLMPTLVHRNLTTAPEDKNDVYAAGIAGRFKLTKRVSLNAEYYYVPEKQILTAYTNVFSLGFDIETGGHVFQLHFTNSPDMTYKGFITETQEPWFFKGSNGNLLTGIRFGFNVSRVFTVVKPKALK